MSRGLEMLKHRISLQVQQLEAHIGMLEQNINKGQRSIDSLTDYVRQYAERLSDMGEETSLLPQAEPKVITGLELQAHNNFADKLMGALKGQVAQNKQNREHLQKALDQLKSFRIQQKTLDTLLNKKAAEKEAARQRAEQRETDDFATVRYSQQMASRRTV